MIRFTGITVSLLLILLLLNACATVSPPTGNINAMLQAGLLRVIEKGRYAPDMVQSKLWPSREKLRCFSSCVGAEESGEAEFSAWAEAITTTIDLLPYGEPSNPQERIVAELLEVMDFSLSELVVLLTAPETGRWFRLAVARDLGRRDPARVLPLLRQVLLWFPDWGMGSSSWGMDHYIMGLWLTHAEAVRYASYRAWSFCLENRRFRVEHKREVLLQMLHEESGIAEKLNLLNDLQEYCWNESVETEAVAILRSPLAIPEQRYRAADYLLKHTAGKYTTEILEIAERVEMVPLKSDEYYLGFKFRSALDARKHFAILMLGYPTPKWAGLVIAFAFTVIGEEREIDPVGYLIGYEIAVRLGNYLKTSFEPERSVVGERRYRETVDRAIAWWVENKAKY